MYGQQVTAFMSSRLQGRSCVLRSPGLSQYTTKPVQTWSQYRWLRYTFFTFLYCKSLWVSKRFKCVFQSLSGAMASEAITQNEIVCVFVCARQNASDEKHVVLSTGSSVPERSEKPPPVAMANHPEVELHYLMLWVLWAHARLVVIWHQPSKHHRNSH